MLKEVKANQEVWDNSANKLQIVGLTNHDSPICSDAFHSVRGG